MRERKQNLREKNHLDTHIHTHTEKSDLMG